MCTLSSSSPEATFGLHRTVYTEAFPGNPPLECLDEGSIMFNGIKGQAWHMLFIWISKRSIFFLLNVWPLPPPAILRKLWNIISEGEIILLLWFNPAFPETDLLYFTITLVFSSDRSHGNLWSGGESSPLPAAITQPSCSSARMLPC